MKTVQTSKKRKSGAAARDLTMVGIFCATTIAFLAVGAVRAANTTSVREVELEERRATISTLKGAEAPVRDMSDYIADKLAAQQLGKALFWDTQVGSDGGACASCHFAAGADTRVTNQVNPGLKGGDSLFSDRYQKAGQPTGPNKTLTKDDFPFHRLAKPDDRESAVLYDTNDVFSSQGTFGGTFKSNKKPAATPDDDASRKNVVLASLPAKNATPAGPTAAAGQPNEDCSYDDTDNPFHANNQITRKVEPRNTPTVINAVFNYRQFWDGRANNSFNGVDPFGPRTFQTPQYANGPGNPNAAITGTLVSLPSLSKRVSRMKLVQLNIPNSSLASQAVGPALSNFEMSCGGKTFQNLGRKLIGLRPLAQQKVHPADSVFARTAGLVTPNGSKGLNTTYKELIEKAFKPKYWSNSHRVRLTAGGHVVNDTNGYTQMEQNFSLFWGLAVQEYMAILVSDDSPFDRAMNGNPSAMSDRAKAGQVLFLTKGNCANCHFGPVFSAAAFTKDDGPSPRVLEHMAMSDGYNGFYDSGFYNIGVRPTSEDIGVGGTDPYGFDLSLARSFKWKQTGKPELAPDTFDPTPCSWLIQYSPCKNVPKWTDPATTERDAVDGSFKVPSLRNVGLTPPYFHNGGEANLRDVVRFYSRGGNRKGPLEDDTTRSIAANKFGQTNKTNLDPDIGEQVTAIAEQHNALLLTEFEIDALVQFLLSLTDERVACQSGVFDHPELPLFMGQQESATVTGKPAADIVKYLPAVGRKGLTDIGKPCLANSGDLFGSVNKDDPNTTTQARLDKILDATAAPERATGSASAQTGTTTTASVTSVTTSVQVASIDATASTPTNTFVTTAPVTAVDATKAGTVRPVATRLNPGFASSVLVPAPPPVAAPVFTTTVDDVHGFTTIGFIQNATISDANCNGLPRSQQGGTAVINGLTIIIPCNTILQMPAQTFTWADLFDPAKFPSIQSPPARLTLASTSASPTAAAPPSFSFPSTEIRVEGNIVAGRHIAGLVYISQQSLNLGTGVITSFEYDKGVIIVGRTIGGVVQPVARLQLNDPKIMSTSDPAFGTGRYSAGQSPDGRFAVDQQNPTIRAASGYPMCVPRVDPAVTTASGAAQDDPLCPQKNRPLVANGCRNFRDAALSLPTLRVLAPPAAGAKFCSGFVMKAPPGTQFGSVLPGTKFPIPTDPVNASFYIAGPGDPDARQQAPFEIGDLINWSGTLLKGDGQGPNGSDTISVNTVIADLGIFTQPGTLPSYIAIGDFRVGTSPPVTTFNGIVLGEIDRIVLEAFTTDLTSIVDIYLVDLDPSLGVTGGAETQRWITPGSMTGSAGAFGSNGSIIDGGIQTQYFGATPGRVRLRATRAVPGILESPTRYIRVAARSLCDPANINSTAPLLGSPSNQVTCLQRAPAANGLYSGQFLAPTPRFIFPENVVPGDPTVPFNFWDLGFLVNGEGPNTGGLIPKPW